MCSNCYFVFVKHVSKIDMDNKENDDILRHYYFNGISPSAYTDAQNLTAFSKRIIMTYLQ